MSNYVQVRNCFNKVMQDLKHNYIECDICNKILNISNGEAYICMVCTSKTMCEPCYYVSYLDWPRLPRRCKQCTTKYLLKQL